MKYVALLILGVSRLCFASPFNDEDASVSSHTSSSERLEEGYPDFSSLSLPPYKVYDSVYLYKICDSSNKKDIVKITILSFPRIGSYFSVHCLNNENYKIPVHEFADFLNQDESLAPATKEEIYEDFKEVIGKDSEGKYFYKYSVDLKIKEHWSKVKESKVKAYWSAAFHSQTPLISEESAPESVITPASVPSHMSSSECLKSIADFSSMRLPVNKSYQNPDDPLKEKEKGMKHIKIFSRGSLNGPSKEEADGEVIQRIRIFSEGSLNVPYFVIYYGRMVPLDKFLPNRYHSFGILPIYQLAEFLNRQKILDPATAEEISKDYQKLIGKDSEGKYFYKYSVDPKSEEWWSLEKVNALRQEIRDRYSVDPKSEGWWSTGDTASNAQR